MSTFLLAAMLFSAPVEFPMESTGVLEAYSFFNQNIEHFIYSNIETDITVLRIGRFSWRLGLHRILPPKVNSTLPTMHPQEPLKRI